MANITDPSEFLTSMRRVQSWIEAHDYKGYEPFDCLESYLRPLSFGTLVGDIILQQVGRQCPVNIRPLMGVKPKDSTKGRSYIAWGHLMRYRVTGDKSHLAKAEMCLDWLDQHKSPLYPKHSWGNEFDYASRGGRMPKHTSTIVWTGLVGQSYLEAFEQTGNPRWMSIVESLCDWIVELPREQTSTGACLSYVVKYQNSIHNSNMLGAAALARAAKHNGNKTYLEVARSAMEYSCTRLLPDGAWYYGEHPKYHWIDCFHTGYNLDSLKRYIKFSGDETFRPQLNLAFKYFKEHFINHDGCPRYYHNRLQPIDIQGAAQVIDTLVFFSEDDPEALDMAASVARWTIKNMQAQDGHFYYRKYPLITAKVPMIHWGQATMFKALANLSSRIEALARKPSAVTL